MTIIFDLDGTLLNTIDDLGHACNHALEACGFPTHPIEEYPRLVGCRKERRPKRPYSVCGSSLCPITMPITAISRGRMRVFPIC